MSRSVLYVYLRELTNEGIRVSFNYFGEYHGKVIYIYKIMFYTINLEIIFLVYERPAFCCLKLLLKKARI